MDEQLREENSFGVGFWCLILCGCGSGLFEFKVRGKNARHKSKSKKKNATFNSTWSYGTCRKWLHDSR